jgi:hypothetical protein
MTYGQLRLLVTAAAPGLNEDLVDGWIDGRYQQILDVLEWERQRVEAVLELVAPYETGTLALTKGSSGVTLVGGTFTSAMTGRALRVVGREEFYEFTCATGATGTLDRAYEGDTATAGAYKIFQHIYVLPSDCRMVEALLAFDGGPLEKLSRGRLNASAPGRPLFGTPRSWAAYMDDSSDPPRQQIEVYPIPDEGIGLPLTYFAEVATPTTTSVSLLPWVRSAAMLAGVTADIQRHLKDYVGAAEYEKQFAGLVALMIRKDARAKGPQRFGMADRFTRHRMARVRR